MRRRRKQHKAWQALLRRVCRLGPGRHVGRSRVKAARIRCRRRARRLSENRLYWWWQGRKRKVLPTASSPPAEPDSSVDFLPRMRSAGWGDFFSTWLCRAVRWWGDAFSCWDPLKGTRVGEASNPGPTDGDASLAAAPVRVPTTTVTPRLLLCRQRSWHEL